MISIRQSIMWIGKEGDYVKNMFLIDWLTLMVSQSAEIKQIFMSTEYGIVFIEHSYLYLKIFFLYRVLLNRDNFQANLFA